MQVTKRVLGKLEKAYALTPILYQGQPHFLVASELEKPCLLFDCEGTQQDVVWEKPGGVMSMVYVPGTNGQFLTTHKFYSFNDAAESVISVVTPASPKNWEIRTVAKLPYVHRIDIIQRGGVSYLIACQLKSDSEYDNDWRFPGNVYVAELPENLLTLQEPLHLELLKSDLPYNHGYYRIEEAGVPSCIISAETGIFQFEPPAYRGGEWSIRLLSSDPTSDAVLLDIDMDGEPELCAISPFHGDTVRIYKKQQDSYEAIYQCDSLLPFCHGFYGGSVCGTPTLLVGHRAGNRDLLAFRWDPVSRSFQKQVLDRDVGPANLMLYQKDGMDILISANREIDEIAMYILES